MDRSLELFCRSRQLEQFIVTSTTPHLEYFYFLLLILNWITFQSNYLNFSSRLYQLLSVVYFDQLSGAANSWKLVKILFWPFSDFLLLFALFFFFSHKKEEKLDKKWVFSYSLKAGRHPNIGRLPEVVVVVFTHLS